MRIQHYHRKTSSYPEGSPSYRKPYVSRSHYGIPSRKPKEVKTSQVPTQNYKKCKSRIVTVIYQEGKKNMGKENLKERLGNNLVRQRYSKKPHSTCFDFPPKRPNHSLACCPNAPHNTTSFLMNFHRDEILNNKLELDRSWTSDDDYDDLPEFPCHSYGSFFGSLGDSYEVASQISAPQQKRPQAGFDVFVEDSAQLQSLKLNFVQVLQGSPVGTLKIFIELMVQLELDARWCSGSNKNAAMRLGCSGVTRMS